MGENSDLKALNEMLTWPVMFLLSMPLLLIMVFQEAWNTISGLYFSHAYEAVVIPSMFYLVYHLKMYADGGRFDECLRTKCVLLFFCFSLLFLPLLYLAEKEELSGHELIFSDFNPELTHMPHAEVLPFIYLFVLFLPIKAVKRLFNKN